jgi:NADPH:quinone reductase-like Zn-dependent oxidoreductase
MLFRGQYLSKLETLSSYKVLAVYLCRYFALVLIPFNFPRSFGLQQAVASGATVIATSSSDSKLAIAKKLGAKHLINYNTTPDWDTEVLKITNSRGADHVIEVGGAGTLQKSLNAIRTTGWIHIIGVLAQTDKPTDIIWPSISKAACIRGILIGSVKQ